MKIDLCKLFGVEEEEEFRLSNSSFKNRIVKNTLQHYVDDDEGNWDWIGNLMFNSVINSEITKLPKKKQFTEDELCILRHIDKKYKWIARDKVAEDEHSNYSNLNIYIGEPYKDTISWLPYDNFCEFRGYNHLFQSIKWEDKEPIRIDDYVKR